MKRSRAPATPDPSLFPENTGYRENVPTLCIGLDFAWFGGSDNDRTSQFDFLAAVLMGVAPGQNTLHCARVRLERRDPEARATVSELSRLIDEHGTKAERIVLAIDAPIQTNRQLPERQPKPSKGSVQRRACDEHLNDRRKRIDKAMGGACGWHPNVQPGAPLPPRLQKFLSAVRESAGLKVWSIESAQANRLVVECFPAEAIWAAKRLDQFPERLSAPVVRAYKEQAGSRLSATQVRELVETTLLEGFKRPSGIPHVWPRLVETVIAWMLNDSHWQVGDLFRGGKLLDDVVDSMICLATAISYAHNAAHVWQHPDHRDDGHIVGPGRFASEETQVKGS